MSIINQSFVDEAQGKNDREKKACSKNRAVYHLVIRSRSPGGQNSVNGKRPSCDKRRCSGTVILGKLIVFEVRSQLRPQHVRFRNIGFYHHKAQETEETMFGKPRHSSVDSWDLSICHAGRC
ncbi:hypothetical protein HGRIS_011584 [Hohenbuehelia grisea]|uniref:Uncharacterized protein n=1 Tax=Hohenbuehelia grisea TaxID=104357 RepID=A0ABR3JWD4_9AGAR